MSVNVFRAALSREAHVPEIGLDTQFSDLDIDPLTVLSVLEQVEQATGVEVPASVFRDCTCLADLYKQLEQPKAPTRTAASLPIQEAATESSRSVVEFATAAGVADFRSTVYPDQQRLIICSIAEALDKLACPLNVPVSGKVVPPISRVQPQHHQLLDALFDILVHDGLLERVDSSSNNSLAQQQFLRTAVSLPSGSTETLYTRILQDHPGHANTHKLLHLTAPKLADCLAGKADPIRLLFGSAVGRDLLQDFYAQAPMSLAASQQLAALFRRVFAGCQEPIEVLEVGAGFGGTTGFILDALASLGVPFRYTFTDVSTSFFKSARQRYEPAGLPVTFEVLDIETPAGPPAHLQGRFHAVLSTNCIHATHDLAVSSANARKLLRPDVDGAFLALVEFTERLFWLDLVFGLLDGWWRFSDGRRHCLASEAIWKEKLEQAGFGQVAFTEGHVEGRKPNPQVIVAWNGTL